MAGPKYILTERVAIGGMAEIHLGKSVGSDGFARICAFKKILPHHASDNEFIQMFRNEAELAKQLLNKNIVQVYDFVAEGDSFMLVMEYVDGQDLRSVLHTAEQSKRRIPIALACYVVIEALGGLGYAHGLADLSGRSLGIIHRDVSPQNILISYEGDVKITDFGIAKAQTHVSNTRAGVLKGKFSYMSPEQAAGNEIDSRSDLFAAGIVLYEMLTMTRLFKGEDLAVLAAVKQCKVKPPNQVKGVQIPQELENCVMRLLERDPERRYQTAKDAIRDISKFLYGYRPDFFAGELAEFMQTLFREKIETSKARMRSTLALPFGNLGPGGLRYTVAEAPGQALFGGGVERLPDAKPEQMTPETVVPQRVQKKESGGKIRRKAPSVGPMLRRPHAIAVGIGLVVTMVASLLFAVVKTRARSSYTDVEIFTRPAVRVLVEVEGQKVFGGRYQSSPIKLRLDRTQNEVVIRRPGFKPKKIYVKHEKGWFSRTEQERVSLEKTAPLGQIKIFTQPPGAVISVEDGLDIGMSPFYFQNLPGARPLTFKITHPRCDTLVTREFLPEQAERTPLVRSYTLKGCR